MAAFELPPEEATSIFDRLDQWYDRGASASTAALAHVQLQSHSPAPVQVHVQPPPRPKGTRTLVRELVATWRRRPMT